MKTHRTWIRQIILGFSLITASVFLFTGCGSVAEEEEDADAPLTAPSAGKSADDYHRDLMRGRLGNDGI